MTDIQQILFKKNDENQTTGYPITKGECIEDLDGNSDFKQVKDDTNKLKEDLNNYLHIDSDNIFDPSKVTKNKYVSS